MKPWNNINKCGRIYHVVLRNSVHIFFRFLPRVFFLYPLITTSEYITLTFFYISYAKNEFSCFRNFQKQKIKYEIYEHVIKSIFILVELRREIFFTFFFFCPHRSTYIYTRSFFTVKSERRIISDILHIVSLYRNFPFIMLTNAAFTPCAFMRGFCIRRVSTGLAYIIRFPMNNRKRQ